uniref:Cytochrome c oxidase subunit 3 n=1 Tax=Olidiana tongmaiensis TaxID=2501809 RepID=A0A898P9C7_9HEMI|nr:cytochrome c oxidase subunit III [Olidiana tongmaiensis]QSJ61399.1 cytochrome c oxidase subunit III [Olidiana tongmaiensis]
MNNHPFHLVDNSPWPITTSMGLLTMTSGLTMMFMKSEYMTLIMGMMITTMSAMQWWRDVIRESTYQGLHTKKVMTSMKLGMMLFILSEIMFFVSFFWTFFHSSLSPAIEIGMQWPPKCIKTFNPMNIPLLNTMILLSSGISITWAHNAILMKNWTATMKSIKITIILGIYFSMIQAIEYYEATFCISDSIYGSTFFLITGFHGIHVIIGTMFIMVTMKRMMSFHFSSYHHIGFETSAWYWHFVDVVWLFLYISIYWWGS